MNCQYLNNLHKMKLGKLCDNKSLNIYFSGLPTLALKTNTNVKPMSDAHAVNIGPLKNVIESSFE